MTLDLLATYALKAGHETLYIPILILGFFMLKEKAFGHAFILLFFTILYNLWLKSLFQMPLPESANKVGLAFPSGHMHAGVIVWGWLMLQYPMRSVRIGLTAVLGALGWALVYKGYHYPMDIFGSIGFGCITLFVYNGCLKLTEDKNPAIMGLMLSAAASVLMFFAIPISMQHFWVWQVYGGLIGFSVSWFIYHLKAKDQVRWPTQASGVLVAVLGMLGIYYLFSFAPTKNMAFYTAQFGCIAFWLGTTKTLVFK